MNCNIIKFDVITAGHCMCCNISQATGCFSFLKTFKLTSNYLPVTHLVHSMAVLGQTQQH